MEFRTKDAPFKTQRIVKLLSPEKTVDEIRRAALIFIGVMAIAYVAIYM
ncbi:hypothetical protein [Gramella sp. AN32]|uniref:TMhelix containing protein n=1 Tax=Christiangramia antarctica TaxID=2058158 RepID=A0ABW5X8M2_9FLAO|nr:hypothetical protein [Gramella sp. AN32]